MTAWSRITGGWARNLDGSDAAAVFNLPRLEVHPTPHGWRSVCLHQDGTRSDRIGHADDSVQVAQQAAERAWGGAG